jgi:cell division septation protein DedD
MERRHRQAGRSGRRLFESAAGLLGEAIALSPHGPHGPRAEAHRRTRHCHCNSMSRAERMGLASAVPNDLITPPLIELSPARRFGCATEAEMWDRTLEGHEDRARLARRWRWGGLVAGAFALVLPVGATELLKTPSPAASAAQVTRLVPVPVQASAPAPAPQPTAKPPAPAPAAALSPTAKPKAKTRRMGGGDEDLEELEVERIRRK